MWMTRGWSPIYMGGLMCGCKLRGKGNKQILNPIPLKLVMWKIRGWLLIYMGGMMCDRKLRGEEKIQILNPIPLWVSLYHEYWISWNSRKNHNHSIYTLFVYVSVNNFLIWFSGFWYKFASNLVRIFWQLSYTHKITI